MGCFPARPNMILISFQSDSLGCCLQGFLTFFLCHCNPLVIWRSLGPLLKLNILNIENKMHSITMETSYIEVELLT